MDRMQINLLNFFVRVVMSKDKLMWWCWKRKLKYSEMYRIGVQKGVEDIPTREEYLDFYREADDSYQQHLE